jgi:hypothetical protein
MIRASIPAPILLRIIGLALVAVAAITCLGDLARPTMAHANAQDCFGPACEDEIACGQPSQPQVTPERSASLVAVPTVVGIDSIPAATNILATGPPVPVQRWHLLSALAPRSPPAA